MPPARRRKNGRVAGLFRATGMSAVKLEVDSLQLTLDGVAEDGHAGRTRPAGVREPAYARGVEIANLRQVSLVSVEELQTIAGLIGMPALNAGWLAANIAIEGAGPITQIPRGTIVRFAGGASLYITDLNTPCTFAAKMINQEAPEPCQPRQFVKAALGRRGLVAMVYSEGLISQGDPVEWITFAPELPNEPGP